MPAIVSLSDAKARLSEVVRAARLQGEETIITVDGEPAVRVVPIGGGPRPLTDAEAATVRVLFSSLSKIERPTDVFDAVDLVRDGRR